jgi:hypothetical protein
LALASIATIMAAMMMLCYGDGQKVLERERHHLWEDFSRKIRNSTRTLQKKPGDYFHDIAMTFIAIMAARVFHRKAKIISSFSSESQDYFCVSNWYTFVS